MRLGMPAFDLRGESLRSLGFGQTAKDGFTEHLAEPAESSNRFVKNNKDKMNRWRQESRVARSPNIQFQ
jgi:hypothetical protein